MFEQIKFTSFLRTMGSSTALGSTLKSPSSTMHAPVLQTERRVTYLSFAFAAHFGLCQQLTCA